MPETSPTAGARLRSALEVERPLQVVGTINAYAALLAQRAGFRAIYLSGAGVANASFGLPDLGITGLGDVCEDVRRISGACALPLLVDADTGFGSAFNIARTTRELIRAAACPSTACASVRAMMTKVGSERASTAARMRSTISSAGTSALPGR